MDGDSDLLGTSGKSGKGMMNAVLAARGKALNAGAKGAPGEIPLPCPDGYDPLKWAQMSRAEKLKILGISEKEWN